MKYPKLLGSSVDANRLALTAKGLLVSVVPIVVIVAGLFNVDLTPNELTEIVNVLFIVVSSCITAYGLGRKITMKFKK